MDEKPPATPLPEKSSQPQTSTTVRHEDKTLLELLTEERAKGNLPPGSVVWIELPTGQKYPIRISH